MTQRRVLSVDFNDIKALEVTCKCGGKLTIPVPKDSLPPHIKCAGCNERL